MANSQNIHWHRPFEKAHRPKQTLAAAQGKIPINESGNVRACQARSSRLVGVFAKYLFVAVRIAKKERGKS